MPNTTIVNFAAGETSPRSRGRFELPWYPSACRKLVNFTPEVQGPARFRTGFKIAAQTRGGAVARMAAFQINDSRAYMLEFTPLKMRVYRDGVLQKTLRTTLTAVTKANPGVATVASITGLANGDEVIFEGIVGMEELNGRQIKVAGVSGATFQLTDPVTGSNINTTNFATYVSGGTVYETYEITTPYNADDLDNLNWASSNGVMYLVSRSYALRKIVVDDAGAFTLSTPSLTASPFSAIASTLSVTGVSSGLVNGRVVISFAAGTTFSGGYYAVADIVGAVELNGQSYRLEAAPVGGPIVWAYLQKTDGSYVTEHPTAYVSGGTATPASDTPLTVGFFEGRLCFLGTEQRPNTLFASRSPNPSTGATRYEDFTGGTDADHACFFSLAADGGRADYSAWLRGNNSFLLAGTFGGPFRISGSGLDEAMAPDSVLSRQFDQVGCEAVPPAAGGQNLYFIERGGRGLWVITLSDDDYKVRCIDLTLNADHVTESRLERVVFLNGRPERLFVVREDGVLMGVTIINGEQVAAGWHRVKIGGTDAKVLDAQPYPRSDNNDQLYVVTERTINGQTRRFVEYQADDVQFPDIEDFYGLGADEDADEELYLNAVYRRQEEYVHLDAAATYNGSDRGVTADAGLTLAALTGTNILVTADAAVFRAGDVGSEIWVKPDRDTGEGGGRGEIVSYVSTTQVRVDITVDFEALTAEAGDWYFAVDDIYVPHLDGATVAVVIDGAVYSDGQGTEEYETATVANSKISLVDGGDSLKAAVVHVGLPYTGFLETHNLELPGFQGPSQTKPRLIRELAIRFLNTMATRYGTNLYDLAAIEFRNPSDAMDRPTPPFSGIKKLSMRDVTSGVDHDEDLEKFVIVSQRLPLPSVVQFIDVRYDAIDEG